MQCQSCHKREATVHVTEISEGVRSELHLCEKCAHQEGIAVKSQIPLNELLSTLLASQPDESDLFAESGQSEPCPHCGFTMSQFRTKTVLGCPYDYEMFETALLPIIERAQNGQTTHTGKVPSRAPVDTKRQITLSALHRGLEAAVQNEDYEKAAKLRDKIKKLKKE